MPLRASASDHLLASYKEALIAIMLRQFDKSKGFKDGMQARQLVPQHEPPLCASGSRAPLLEGSVRAGQY